MTLDYQNIATENEVYVAQTAYNEHPAFLFKQQHTNNTDPIVVTAKARSNIAPSTSPVYLAIYSYTHLQWSLVDMNNTAGANEKFTLSCVQSDNLSYYYGPDNWVSFRVFQGSE